MSKLRCLVCDWIGEENELVIPNAILDDDRPDYGGDCPNCGATSNTGEIEDYEGEGEEVESEYIQQMADRFGVGGKY